jgi:hypothetical protein
MIKLITLKNAKTPSISSRRFLCLGLDFLRTSGAQKIQKRWSYPMPLNAFGVSSIFVSSLVKASFHRSKIKMPLKLRLKGIVPGTGIIPYYILY